jgi:hypothetical protein
VARLTCQVNLARQHARLHAVYDLERATYPISSMAAALEVCCASKREHAGPAKGEILAIDNILHHAHILNRREEVLDVLFILVLSYARRDVSFVVSFASQGQ